MSHTITIDVLSDKAMSLLIDLERQQLIKVRGTEKDSVSSNSGNKKSRYKGAMSKQSIASIDSQLNELRREWN